MAADVIETPERLQFDENALDRYMTEQIADYQGPLSVKKFSGGESNPTYLLTTPKRKYVLRRKPPGKLLPSAHAVDREFRVMTAVGQTGYPVPKTYFLCDDETIIGTMFYVMEFVEGRIFWDWVIEDAEPAVRRDLFNAAIDNLAALHNIDLAAVGLSDFGKHTDYFARQISRWSGQYKAAETDQIPAMDKLIDWLPDNIPAGEVTTIVHGDYKLDNLVFDPDQSKVIATLDWELSTLGHPLADFSYFLMPWGLPRSSTMGYQDIDFAHYNIPTMEEAIERYCQQTGQSGLPDINFCMAYNMFRLAGIVQGVYKRSLQGNASSTKAGKYGIFAKFLSETGWQFAQKAGAQ
ncbi:MAG: phosphotransferase family protein [bacterium]